MKPRYRLIISRWNRLFTAAQKGGKLIRNWAKKHKKNIFLGAIIFFVLGTILTATLLKGIAIGKERLAHADSSIRFGAIGDFEYGTRKKVGNKLTSLTPSELEKVVAFYNAEWQPAFVVELGDMVESSGVKPSKAIRQFLDIDTVFQKLDARTEYVLGNHDLRSLSKEDLRKTLGLSDNHRYFDEGAWRFVIMDTNFDKERDGAPLGPHHYVFGFVPESEFVWLEEALDTDRPTIIFLHHPPIPGEKNLRNYKEVREFFARYPHVTLTISGHDPSFKFFEENGFSSLVVDNLANKDSIGSFATLDARYNSLTREASVLIEHYGPTRQSLEVKKTLPGPRPRWVNIMDRLGIKE